MNTLSPTEIVRQCRVSLKKMDYISKHMSDLVHIAQTITSTVRHLIKGDQRSTRIFTGVVVLAYIYFLRSVIGVVLNLIFLILKTILLVVVSLPYMVAGFVAMRMSTDKRLGARTRAMMVAVSVLCTYITFPHATRMEFGNMSALSSEEVTRVLNIGHKRFTRDLFANNFVQGLQLPSSIDAIKIVCFSVILVAALKQSNTNPKPTLLNALLS